MSDEQLLAPSVDPKKKAIGIRRVVARNEASTRTVMMVRDHILVSDEKGTNTGPTPLEMYWRNQRRERTRPARRQPVRCRHPAVPLRRLSAAAGRGTGLPVPRHRHVRHYPVRGCQVVLPPDRRSDITVENGGTLRAFNTKFFLWRDLFLGAASDTGSTVELRGVAIDSCNVVYFRATNLDLQDIEIYNNANLGATAPQCAEIIVSPDTCSNFLVHDCNQGMHFRADVTMTEYRAQDNTNDDLAVLDGFEATLVDSFFDNTKIGRLTT